MSFQIVCDTCGRTGPKDYDIDKVIEEARTAYWYLTPHVDCCPQCGREERYIAHKIPMGLKERE